MQSTLRSSAIFVAVLVLGGGAGAEPTVEWEQLRSSQLGFSIHVPAAWPEVWEERCVDYEVKHPVYSSFEPEEFGYRVTHRHIDYQSADGWTHSNLAVYFHPNPGQHRGLSEWIGGWNDTVDLDVAEGAPAIRAFLIYPLDKGGMDSDSSLSLSVLASDGRQLLVVGQPVSKQDQSIIIDVARSIRFFNQTPAMSEAVDDVRTLSAGGFEFDYPESWRPVVPIIDGRQGYEPTLLLDTLRNYGGPTSGGKWSLRWTLAAVVVSPQPTPGVDRRLGQYQIKLEERGHNPEWTTSQSGVRLLSSRTDPFPLQSRVSFHATASDTNQLGLHCYPPYKPAETREDSIARMIESIRFEPLGAAVKPAPAAP